PRHRRRGGELRQLRRRYLRHLRPTADRGRRLSGRRARGADRRWHRVLRHGRGSDGAGHVQGQGTLAISGGGHLRVRPNVAVTGVLETEIEAHGVTRLVQSDANYFLFALADGSGPELRYAGAPVTTGLFGAWMPIAAERIAGGYEVARKMGTDQYSVWTTDESGNMLANPSGVVS